MSYSKFNSNYNSDEFADQGGSGSKHILSKFDYDLFDEEQNMAEKIIRVRRISLPNKDVKWKIIDDGKTVFTIESHKLSKKEKKFLLTVDGFNFILSQAKTGIKSLHKFRTELKIIMLKKK